MRKAADLSWWNKTIKWNSILWETQPEMERCQLSLRVCACVHALNEVEVTLGKEREACIARGRIGEMIVKTSYRLDLCVDEHPHRNVPILCTSFNVSFFITTSSSISLHLCCCKMSEQKNWNYTLCQQLCRCEVNKYWSMQNLQT